MLQKVAVISAGISGLTSIKACLEEGLQPECFESSYDIGGLRRFKDDPEPERANIYSSVIINSSKERMAFSDFPPPAELPNNMHHSGVLLYIRLHAQAFRLLQHIRFKTTVVSVRQTLDFASTGQWEVETESRDGQRETRVFDAVIVCTGHFTQPHLPLKDFPGVPQHQERSVGCDPCRQGGVPVDMLGVSCMDTMLQQLFPTWSARVMEKKVNNVDVVVFVTGYNYSFPSLPSALQTKCGYRLRLYKHVFPPALTQPTLAVVGFFHGLGAITPLVEMQARWAARVFKCLNHLPSEETMLEEIVKDTAIMHQRYACSERTPIQVDYIPYLDSLAEQVGVRPNILRLFLKDPRLALQVLTGPCTPYQYRLTGPGQWAGAREAILTQWERVLQPFRTRVVPEPESRPSSRRSVVVMVSGAALLCCFCYNKHPLSSLLSMQSLFRSLD